MTLPDSRRGNQVPGQRLELITQPGLVPLNGEHVVRASGRDLCSGVGLGMHRVDRQNRAVQILGIERADQVPDGGNLVGLLFGRRLGENRASAVVQSTDQVRSLRDLGSGTP